MVTKVGIVGCGALGSVFAAHLCRSPDIEVHAYDVSQEQIRAINDRGLRISGAAEFTVQFHPTSDPRELPKCDFGIIATKSLHTRAAAGQVAHAFNESSAVCSVQNGLGNEEIIAEYVKHVIRGATPMAAHLISPGHAGFEFYSDIWIGPFEPAGTPYRKVEQLAAILARAGLRVVPLEDARGAQWTKLIFNSAVNPVGALTQLHHGAAARFPQTAALYEALLREGKSFAKALGITLHGDPRHLIAEGARPHRKRNVRMLPAIRARRHPEVDFMNGAIVNLGEKLGGRVSLNRALWRLVKGLEHSWPDGS